MYLEECIKLAPEQPAYLALLAEFNSGDYSGAYDVAKLWCKNDKSQKSQKDIRGENKASSGNKDSVFGQAKTSYKIVTGEKLTTSSSKLMLESRRRILTFSSVMTKINNR